MLGQSTLIWALTNSVPDPGFPQEDVDLVRGGVNSRGGYFFLCFKNFVCQNERIWGGGAPGKTPPRSANEIVIYCLHMIALKLVQLYALFVNRLCRDTIVPYIHAYNTVSYSVVGL